LPKVPADDARHRVPVDREALLVRRVQERRSADFPAMTIEELKQAIEDIEINDLVAHAEEVRDVMLMIAAKLGEIEKRIDKI
jgi:hypothetical protein